MRRTRRPAVEARTRRRLRRLLLPAVLTAAIAASVPLVASALQAQGPVARVDDAAIDEDAIRFYAGLVQRTVEDDVRNGRLSADDARTALRERALEMAIEDHVLLTLAHEEGVTGLADFDDLAADLERENQQRRSLLERGEIVYGSPEFDLAEYRAKVVTDLRSALERLHLASDEAPDGTDLRAEFERDADAWALAATTYDVRVLIVPFDSAAEEDCAAALGGTAELDLLAERCAGARLESERYDGAQPPAQASPQFARLTAIADLRAGERSRPQAEDGGVGVVELVTAETDAETAFVTYRDRIAVVLAERWLDELLDRRLADSEIDIDAPRLTAVDLEENDR